MRSSQPAMWPITAVAAPLRCSRASGTASRATWTKRRLRGLRDNMAAFNILQVCSSLGAERPSSRGGLVNSRSMRSDRSRVARTSLGSTWSLRAGAARPTSSSTATVARNDSRSARSRAGDTPTAPLREAMCTSVQSERSRGAVLPAGGRGDAPAGRLRAPEAARNHSRNHSSRLRKAVRPHNGKPLQGLHFKEIGTAGFEPATP